MRKLLLIPAILCGMVAAYGAADTFQAPDGGKVVVLLVLLAITFALVKAAMKKKKAPAPKQPPRTQPEVRVEQQAAPAPAVPAPQRKKLKVVYEGKVKGVTFDGRQRVLAKFMRLEEDCETIFYSLERSTYQGKPSIKVMGEVSGEDKPAKQLGFIADKDVEKVLPYIDTASVECEIYGGPEYDGDDRSYGASVTLLVRE